MTEANTHLDGQVKFAHHEDGNIGLFFSYSKTEDDTYVTIDVGGTTISLTFYEISQIKQHTQQFHKAHQAFNGERID